MQVDEWIHPTDSYGGLVTGGEEMGETVLFTHQNWQTEIGEVGAKVYMTDLT
jgi:hypothetical protein